MERTTLEAPGPNAAPHADELLRPSLDETHDLAGFERPFDPGYLPFVVMVGGALCGGAIVAWNWRRLGLASRALPSFLGFAALWLAITLSFGFVFEWSKPAPAPQGTATRQITGGAAGGRYATTRDPARDRQRFLRFVAQAIAVVPALVSARRQQRRVRIHEQAGGKGSRLLGIGMLAMALNIALGFASAALFASLFRPGGAL